ncbi:hypothetical protein [Runella zeae]|uniref:hypothetical protein n=1 Tax=Runella zeae TaxID=94255 RepID=UPI0004908651|nr:hypothetical protein [Runella zeae]
MKIALYIWACFQNLFFGLTILYFKRNKANLLLASFFLLASCLIGVQYLLRFRGYLVSFPQMAFVSDTINLAFGLTAYLYLYQVLYRRLPRNWYYTPPVGFAVSFVGYQLIYSAPFHLSNYFHTWHHPITLVAIALSFSVYAYY